MSNVGVEHKKSSVDFPGEYLLSGFSSLLICVRL